MGALIDGDGELVGGATFVIADAALEQDEPSVVAQGAGFLVAYMDNRYVDVPIYDIRITTVGANRAVGTTDGVLVLETTAEHESLPELIPGASGPLLVYRRAAGGGSGYRALHLDASGAAMGATPYSLGPASTNDRASGYFDGTDHVVLMHHSATGWDTVKVGATGAIVFDVTPSINGMIAGAIAGDGEGGGLISYVQDHPNSISMPKHWLGNRFDEFGFTYPTIVIGGGTRNVHSLGLAGNGSGYLSVYREVESTTFSPAHAVGLDFEGRPRGLPVELSDAVSSGTVVVRPDGNYLLAYMSDLNRIRYAVLDPLGNIVGPSGYTTLSNVSGPKLSASDDSAIFVISGSNTVRWQRWTFDAVAPVALAVVTTATGNESNGDVATFDGVHLIVWEDRRESATNGIDVYGLRVRDDGVLVSGNAIPIITGADDQSMPVVAATSAGWIVAWRNEGATISLRTVDAAGSTGTVATLSTTSAVDHMALVASEDQALIAWTISPGSVSSTYAQRLTHAGALVSSAFEIGDDRSHWLHALASTQREFLVSHGANDSAAQNGRIYHRRVTVGAPIGASCEDDGDCEGTCNDDVCCAQDCGDDTGDCRACSAALGAPFDGACALRPATAVCRSAAHVCDVAELCSGAGQGCPGDELWPDAASCSDLDACNGEERCYSGVCTDDDPVACDDGDACTTDSCDSDTGCEYAAIDGCAEPEPDAGTNEPDSGMPVAGAGGSSGEGGASGMNGSGGEGGASGVNGSSGEGGGSGMAGSSGEGGGSGTTNPQAGTGGAPATDAGDFPDAGDDEDPAAGGKSGGGCSAAARGRSPLDAVWLLLIALAFVRRSAPYFTAGR